MGKRGPLRLVTATVGVDEALAGTAQMDVPEAAKGIYKPARVKQSESLSELWDEIVPPLEKAGILTSLDVPALEAAIRHFRAFISIDDEWASDQFETASHTESGPKRNPMEQAHRAQSQAFMDYCKQLGMTFAARARTEGRDSNGDAGDNPFESAAV